MSPLEATLLTLTGIYLLNQCSILYQVHGVHVLEDIDAAIRVSDHPRLQRGEHD